MFISTTRQKYVLDKCAESIKSAHSYSLSTLSYSKTFTLKYMMNNREYGIAFPEYNLMEERNDILDDLLNNSSKEEEEEVTEEIKEEKPEKPNKKKWWKIW